MYINYLEFSGIHGSCSLTIVRSRTFQGLPIRTVQTMPTHRTDSPHCCRMFCHQTLLHEYHSQMASGPELCECHFYQPCRQDPGELVGLFLVQSSVTNTTFVHKFTIHINGKCLYLAEVLFLLCTYLLFRVSQKRFKIQNPHKYYWAMSGKRPTQQGQGFIQLMTCK